MAPGPLDVAIVQLFDLPARMAHAHQIAHTGRALADRGHRVTLFARVPRGADAGELLRAAYGFGTSERLRVEAVRWRHKGLSGLAYRRRLARLLAAGGTRFWVRQRRHALWLLDRRARRGAGAGVEIAYEFHNLEHVLAAEAGREEDAARIRAEEQRVARGADVLAAIGAPLADDVAAAFGVPRPAVVPDGVDLALFREAPREALADERATVVYAGGLFEHKGVDDLVAALAECPARVRLRIVGGDRGPDRARLEQLAASLDLRERVAFTGAVPPRDVPGELARADLIALPAGHETRATRYTSPLKLFEAMATGLPIVAAATPALASVLEDGRTAFVADAHSPAGLARAIGRALADPAGARAAGRAARREAERYTWDARAATIERLLAHDGAS